MLNILDPVSRISEILFGLIMVLTFTCSLSVMESGREDVREMLIGALGCNIAWGVIDAFFYLISALAEKGRERLLIKKLADISDQQSAQKLFEHFIPASIRGSLSPAGFSEVREYLLRKSETKNEALITFSDLKAAGVVFALVFLSTFPVAIPFMIVSEPWVALRTSNLVALLLLFALGFSLGRYAGRRPIVWGLGMMIIGAFLVSITIALGG